MADLGLIRLINRLIDRLIDRFVNYIVLFSALTLLFGWCEGHPWKTRVTNLPRFSSGTNGGRKQRRNRLPRLMWQTGIETDDDWKSQRFCCCCCMFVGELPTVHYCPHSTTAGALRRIRASLNVAKRQSVRWRFVLLQYQLLSSMLSSVVAYEL